MLLHICCCCCSSCVWLFATPWTVACQTHLFSTISQSLLKFMSIESVILSNYLILFHPLLLLPSIFPSIWVFSSKKTLQWKGSSHQVAWVLAIHTHTHTHTHTHMVGWHHWLNEHEFEQALGNGEGQGSLVCCSPWGCKASDTTERLNNNNNIHSTLSLVCIYALSPVNRRGIWGSERICPSHRSQSWKHWTWNSRPSAFHAGSVSLWVCNHWGLVPLPEVSQRKTTELKRKKYLMTFIMLCQTNSPGSPASLWANQLKNGLFFSLSISCAWHRASQGTMCWTNEVTHSQSYRAQCRAGMPTLGSHLPT